MSAGPRQLLERLLAGVSEGRWGELSELYAEDAVVEHPLDLPVPTRLEGRAAIHDHFERAARAGLVLRPEHLVVHETTDPELIVAEFAYAGRTTNVFVLRARGGQIVESRDYIHQERTQMNYSIYIKAPREVVWDALTTPESTARYGYGAPVEIELAEGGSFRQLATEEIKQHGGPEVIADGEVLEVDAPQKLVHTSRFLWDPETVSEGHTTVAYELETSPSGATKLTVRHQLDGAPRTAAMVNGEVAGGGWPEILSDLKSLLETGTPLAG
jgi:uncharacterized protein YndB with AHSA1/START domain/ketosteroid isomerase-like protein